MENALRRTDLNPSQIALRVGGMIRLRKFPREAEEDILRALAEVSPQSQELFSWAAHDADLPLGRAIERLMTVLLLSAAVNLADDLADGDCDYLEPRVGPGILFLLSTLSTLPLMRSDLKIEDVSLVAIGLARAASGQSLEVRGHTRSALEYLQVADLIAGAQYCAYFRLIWAGTALEVHAERVGALLGRLAIIYTDLASHDPRLVELPPEDSHEVRRTARLSLADLRNYAHLSSVSRFIEVAEPLLSR
jgi:hypothetical protein